GKRNKAEGVGGAGGYHPLPGAGDFNGAKVTAPFRDLNPPEFVLESYVDDTHGFMGVEIEGDLVTCRYFAVPRPQDPPNLPARIADFFQVNWRSDRLLR